MTLKLQYLSYILDANTPTYGNRNKFICEKKSSIIDGDVANDSTINTTVHIGTHIDMPYHFFEDGQTIKDFDIGFFRSSNVVFIDMIPENIIIKDDFIAYLETIEDKKKYEIIIVKSGICHKRDDSEFWSTNYGFDPSVAEYLREKFPNVRILGFDTVSVSSFTDRMLGREAHKAFLNPKKPILLLEDMDLRELNNDSIINKIEVTPLRISKCDGLPCTVIAEIN